MKSINIKSIFIKNIILLMYIFIVIFHIHLTTYASDENNSVDNSEDKKVSDSKDNLEKDMSIEKLKLLMKMREFTIYEKLSFSWNELGISNTLIFSKFIDLSSVAELCQSNYMEIALYEEFTPSYNQVGTYIELEPIAILNIYTGIYFLSYYNTFGYGLYQVDYPNEKWDSSTRSDNSDRFTSAYGYHIKINPTLKFPVDPTGCLPFFSNLYFIYSPEYNYWSINSIDKQYIKNKEINDVYFYEYINDVVQPNKTWSFVHSITFMYFPSDVIVGLNYTRVVVPSISLYSEKIGPIFVYAFAKKIGTFINPRLVFLAQYYTKETYKKDELYLAGQFMIRYDYIPN